MTTHTFTTTAKHWHPRRHRPSWLTELDARVHARSLDRDIVRGDAPWRSAVHAARYRQLTSRRRRNQLAKTLRRLPVDARRPVHHYRLSASVPPARHYVLAAEPQINAIAAALEDEAPIRGEGIVRLTLLLTDGSGPVYMHQLGAGPDALARALQRVLDNLIARE